MSRENSKKARIRKMESLGRNPERETETEGET